MSDNAIVREALEAMEQIDAEARQKKDAQIERLRSARGELSNRLDELSAQLRQVDAAIGVTKKVAANGHTKSPRRANGEVSELATRIGRWLETKPGQSFSARQLLNEFPELEKTRASVLKRVRTLNPKIVMTGIKSHASYAFQGG